MGVQSIRMVGMVPKVPLGDFVSLPDELNILLAVHVGHHAIKLISGIGQHLKLSVVVVHGS